MNVIDAQGILSAIDSRLLQLGLSITSTFVPASARADEWQRGAINFDVHITTAEGATVYRGPYAYGAGRLPGWSQHWAKMLIGEPIAIGARERGMWPKNGMRGFEKGGTPGPHREPVPAPTLADVIASLVMDADALDHASFESWAHDYGYDTDSRSAERTYRACLENALRMRAVLGDAVLAELRELFADY